MMKKEIPYNSIARFITGNCTPEEAEKITTWIESSNENKKIFDEIYNLWEKTGECRNTKEYDAVDALHKIKNKLSDDNKKNQQIHTMLPMWVKLAAVFLLIAACTFILVKFYHTPVAKQIAFSTYENKEKIVLTDGTVIWLNNNSTLLYPEKFGRKERKVSLTGEAFFEVSKEPKRPFIIETARAYVKVLGTSFNVSARNDAGKTIVAVESGVVEFSVVQSINENIRLEKGEMGIFENTAQNIVKKPITDPNIFSWKTGELRFKNTSFKKTIDEIAAFYQREIKILDTTLYNEKFNAYFGNIPFEKVVNILKMNMNLQVVDSSGVIVITKK